MIGIKYPIFQGGMAWIADANLAAAVSNGGGLGIISAMNADAEYLRGQIVRARELTDEPFGVNIMLMSPFADEVAQIAAEEKVKVITTGAGNPTKYMKLWKDAGITVVPVVASCAMAKMVERAGRGYRGGAGIRRTHRRALHHGDGSAGRGCRFDSRACRRRNRRRTRSCGIVHARSSRSSARNTFPRRARMRSTSELQGCRARRRGHIHGNDGTPPAVRSRIPSRAIL